jgi:hypothetical protein
VRVRLDPVGLAPSVRPGVSGARLLAAAQLRAALQAGAADGWPVDGDEVGVGAGDPPPDGLEARARPLDGR